MSLADAEAFKAGMRHLAAHVCLITTVGPDGARRGLTATAVCSVSADPPTLLCCVNRQISPFAAIRESGIFAVNVLGVEDLELAERFAGEIQGEARFEIGCWIALATGAPALESALATFDCRMTRLEEVATHGILFGEIQAIRSRESTAQTIRSRESTAQTIRSRESAAQTIRSRESAAQTIRSRESNAEPLLYSHGTFGAFEPLDESKTRIVQFK